jgi:hypothetical protein
MPTARRRPGEPINDKRSNAINAAVAAVFATRSERAVIAPG